MPIGLSPPDCTCLIMLPVILPKVNRFSGAVPAVCHLIVSVTVQALALQIAFCAMLLANRRPAL